MSEKSSIEWTDSSWNPVRGCVKISPGCKNCYAERFAERFRGVPGSPYEQGFDLRLVEDHLDDPLRWKKPRMIFVCSMSDLFQQEVPIEYIRLVCEVMRKADRHIYQVLTKRSERMRDLLQGELAEFAELPQIWWGVSVEDRIYGLPRIDHLRKISVPMRWLSIEPLLENLGEINLDGIHWVVVGGESGPGARTMEEDWVRSIRNQCFVCGVPFFFKQWGGKIKSNNGRLLDGRIWNEFPKSVTKDKNVEIGPD